MDVSNATQMQTASALQNDGVYTMKFINVSAAALIVSLTATAAFAGNADYAGDREYLAHKGQVDFAPTASIGAAPSGFIVTYPTNADSVVNETPAQRNEWLGSRGH